MACRLLGMITCAAGGASGDFDAWIVVRRKRAAGGVGRKSGPAGRVPALHHCRVPRFGTPSRVPCLSGVLRHGFGYETVAPGLGVVALQNAVGCAGRGGLHGGTDSGRALPAVPIVFDSPPDRNVPGLNAIELSSSSPVNAKYDVARSADRTVQSNVKLRAA